MAPQGHVNRFVDYLNTLRTQTEAGNAFCFHEARGQATSLAQFGLSPVSHLHTHQARLVGRGRFAARFPVPHDSADGRCGRRKNSVL